ncbi:MAG: hypothetical protein AMXMBFR84_32800 [Candidatus Hydrogenedentota bacterium]
MDPTEDQLKRYRPVAPGAHVRARVLAVAAKSEYETDRHWTAPAIRLALAALVVTFGWAQWNEKRISARRADASHLQMAERKSEIKTEVEATFADSTTPEMREYLTAQLSRPVPNRMPPSPVQIEQALAAHINLKFERDNHVNI